MKFLSVCSGVEAASLALNPLGFKAAAFSEVDPFCCDFLNQRYPGIPNFGDLTKWRNWDLPNADILVGGTPCQAFSVAGKRASLDDDRSNLALDFVELFHAGGFVCSLWENVPGVLNTKDNAFGCFLGGIVGSDNPLREPPNGRWPSVGMASGPRARVTWRVFDAQYFGVPQRRRRVFVIASARDWFDPAKVLFEPKSMQGNSSARKETRQNLAGCLSARTEGGGGLGTDFELDGGLQVFGGNNTSGPIDVATALNAHGGPNGRCDFESETFVTYGGAELELSEELSPCLRGSDGGSSKALVFNCKDSGEHIADLAPTLRAMNHDGSHANAGGQLAVANQFGVRRLIPVECERLQGMPDQHTAIMRKGKPAADGPRYKSIGNSWPAPVIRWIGRGIKEQFDAAAAIESIAA